MNEQRIREIVKEELKNNFRKGSPEVPPHRHNNIDNLGIPSSSLIISSASLGKITFANQKTYTLNFNSDSPTRIDVNGFVFNNAVTYYSLIVGVAILNSAYYFQPNSPSSVTTGGTKYPVTGALPYVDSPRLAQCSSSLTIDQSSLSNTYPSSNQFRAVYANSVGGVLISAYFDNLTKNSVDLIVETLNSGFEAKLNIIIT